MAGLGELERSVMEQLWMSDTPLTANEVRDRLAEVGDASHGPATTTVLTVLSRLERKGFVARARDARPHRYHALLSRADHTAELMHEVLDRHPHVVDCAREAITRAGMAVRERAIRGGTDGSRLSFMGLPTPNIFAGEQNFHSRLEWVSVQDMEKAVQTIVELAKVWEARTV